MFLKDYANHVLADDVLFGIARLKAERLNDFSGAQEALDAIQRQYPKGDIAPEAKLYAQRLKAALEAAKSGTPGKKAAALLTDMKWENRKNLAVVTLEFDRPIIWSIDTQRGGKKNAAPNRMVVDLMGVNPASTIRPGIKVQAVPSAVCALTCPHPTRRGFCLISGRSNASWSKRNPRRSVSSSRPRRRMAAMPRGIPFGQGFRSSDPIFRFATRSVVIDPGHGGKDPGTVHNASSSAK